MACSDCRGLGAAAEAAAAHPRITASAAINFFIGKKACSVLRNNLCEQGRSTAGIILSTFPIGS
jgi:hypothetical protein